MERHLTEDYLLLRVSKNFLLALASSLPQDTRQIAEMIAKAALAFVVGITYLGAFSRFTHGRYTPRFHQYQVDRAPDDESTRYIPLIDLTVATLLLFPVTRTAAALLATAFQGFGILLRVKQQKPLLTDVALATTAAFVAWQSATGGL